MKCYRTVGFNTFVTLLITGMVCGLLACKERYRGYPGEKVILTEGVQTGDNFGALGAEEKKEVAEVERSLFGFIVPKKGFKLMLRNQQEIAFDDFVRQNPSDFFISAAVSPEAPPIVYRLSKVEDRVAARKSYNLSIFDHIDSPTPRASTEFQIDLTEEVAPQLNQISKEVHAFEKKLDETVYRYRIPEGKKFNTLVGANYNKKEGPLSEIIFLGMVTSWYVSFWELCKKSKSPAKTDLQGFLTFSIEGFNLWFRPQYPPLI